MKMNVAKQYARARSSAQRVNFNSVVNCLVNQVGLQTTQCQLLLGQSRIHNGHQANPPHKHTVQWADDLITDEIRRTSSLRPKMIGHLENKHHYRNVLFRTNAKQPRRSTPAHVQMVD